jgi:hypothetical protein
MSKDKKGPSERVILNRVAKTINEMGPAFSVEILSRGVGSFQVILYGLRCNVVFVGDFKDCQSYLWGVRDVVTVGGTNG